MVTLQPTLLVAVLCVAVVLDLRARQIPNFVTVVGVCIGLMLGLGQSTGWLTQTPVGASSFLAALAGAGIALGAGLLLFALGAFGAGDGKLLAVVGAFVGPSGLISTALYTAIAGGLMVLALTIKRGTVVDTLRRTGLVVLAYVSMGARGRPIRLDSPDAVTIPYALPIASGALLAWFLPDLTAVIR